MRPVNLIPPDERRGDHRPLRTGPVAYIVVGALALALLGVTMLVLANNDIADRKAEVETLQREDALAKARAERLAPYVRFQAMSEERVATVVSLANSRFDWERVMRELALILPGNVWLVSLNASASAESGSGGEGGGGGLRGGIAGPALELTGCAAGQDAVAGFVTALNDIDAVTRVGVQSAELASKGVSAGGGGGGEDCRTREFIAQFSVVVAFDAAPVPVVGAEAAAPPPEEAEGEEEAGEEGS
jgi:Tfp pilus assembly protein PilN